MNNQTIALRAQELVNSGMTMVEALTKALEEAKVTGQQRAINPADRPTWITTIDDIQDLRKAIKSAFGKKSKAKDGNQESFNRACAEVKAGQDKLNSILATIAAAADPIAEARKYNESASGITQMLLVKLDAQLDDMLEMLRVVRNMTKTDLKKAYQQMPAELTEQLFTEVSAVGQDVLEIFIERSMKDPWVQTICQKAQYMNTIQK